MASEDGGAESLLEIVRACKEIEEVAYRFYSTLSMSSKDREDAEFWLRAAEDVWSYAEYWEKSMALAERGMLPQIFERPEELRDELTTIVGKMLEILSEVDLCLKDPSFAMTMAFKIEFYSIHRALVPLVNIMKSLGRSEHCPYDGFSKHLESFLAIFKARRGVIRPELQLLAETIGRLWTDNLRLSRDCYFDELTGLLNRRGFHNAVLPLLSLAKRRKGLVAALMLDIDHFKMVNDSLGHDAGDKVLARVASTIKDSIRDSDVCARYGGEEFVVFCPELAPQSVFIIAEKLRAAVEANAEFPPVTVSIGAVEMPIGFVESETQEDLAYLLKCSDILLYDAKSKGRNRCSCQGAEVQENAAKQQVAEVQQ